MGKLPTIIFTLFLFSAINCRRQPILSLKNNKHNQTIAFLPLDNFTIPGIDSMLTEISSFYDKRVIILHSASVPSNYLNASMGQYSADSILDFLENSRNDSLVEIVGLTDKPIFFMNKDHKIPYYEKSIFGFGDHPGNVCIISDFRLKTTNAVIYRSRLKKVIIHEVGHNMGLSHCGNDKCIMSAKNDGLKNLDSNDFNYC